MSTRSPPPPRPHAPTNVAGQGFSYDPNGNMLTGLDGKVMTYDAENRPLTVTLAGVQTRYTYAADGTRLKMISNYGTAQASTTLTLGPLEIQNFGGVTTDDNYIDTPHPDIRVVNAVVSYLHHDALGSVILITNGTGAKAREVAYRPYGEVLYNGNFLPAVPGEARGFIGERFDAGAGLQYLNARYYDPKLGMFLQPDWFEVTAAGVGTNRYAYAGGDPVNGRDAGGNATCSGLNGKQCQTAQNAVSSAKSMLSEARDQLRNFSRYLQEGRQPHILSGFYGLARRFERLVGTAATAENTTLIADDAQRVIDFLDSDETLLAPATPENRSIHAYIVPGDEKGIYLGDSFFASDSLEGQGFSILHEGSHIVRQVGDEEIPSGMFGGPYGDEVGQVRTIDDVTRTYAYGRLGSEYYASVSPNPLLNNDNFGCLITLFCGP